MIRGGEVFFMMIITWKQKTSKLQGSKITETQELHVIEFAFQCKQKRLFPFPSKVHRV